MPCVPLSDNGLDEVTGSDCNHNYEPEHAVYCGTKLRLLHRCTVCDRSRETVTRVDAGVRRRPCPLCGGRVLLGGVSVLQPGRFSIGKVCITCHVSIRVESDPQFSQSIRVVSSEPSVYDDR
jgi:hypothetical protein